MLPKLTDIWTKSEYNFNEYALEIFRYQVKTNSVFRDYVNLIGTDVNSISKIEDIPFLPISFFKTQKIACFSNEAETVFTSSSTTGTGISRHYIRSIEDYHQNCLNIINQTIGRLSDYSILGLLPSYLERGSSSLVSMVKFFMDQTEKQKGFFLDDFDALEYQLRDNQNSSIPTLLIGVSFALLDFAEKCRTPDSKLLILETGGMKGRKKEITKAEVYQKLKASFPNAQIMSEYGMTELMSQAYSNDNGIYTCPPWMKILGRDDNDPMGNAEFGRTCALNIIDLANINTCSFIATDDLGKVYEDGRFEVLGRLDYSDIRGCSLLV